jgi:hypothetical protein
MSDQFLRAHEMMEYAYSVADVAYPVSIRDQMNRARWLVQKAHDLGFFGPKRDPKYCRLLVCGAGASGATAALHAISLGVKTVLVERSNAPFLRQRLCRSRWIDPTQYDWSAAHWTTATFPHTGPVMPLPWVADRSHRLAVAWQMRLSTAIHNPLLTFRRPEHVVGAPAPIPSATGSADGLRVSFHSGVTEDFGMMLWCVGFFDERRFAPPSYTGFAFWDTDPYEHPDWGVVSPPKDLSGMVSGGGDGALQDVLRLATRRKSADDVYQELCRSGWSIPDGVRHALFAAEDQAQRALLWCQPRSQDEHQALQRLHDEYARAVGYLVTADPNRTKLVAEAGRVLSANSHPLQLVHPCTHFGRCYGLNHLLVLLLARVASETALTAGPRIRGGLVVDRVSGHACAGHPWACHGVRHTVHLRHRPSCLAPPGGAAGTEDIHVLVLRHGIAPHPALVGTPLAFARQVMPYHLP